MSLPPGIRTGHGIIVAPLLAGPELLTYRVRRHWAEAFAQAGHCAVRLDLPGAGDSVGDPATVTSLSTWTDALSAAARWLRDEAGCTRITLLGIGSGGLLGWITAAGDVAIDDLILWNVPLTGRRMLREIRTAAMLSIDHELPAELDDATVEAPMIDEAGQPMTEETIAELSAIDLRRLSLGADRPRRVLLLARPQSSSDAALQEALTGGGVELSIGPGTEFDRMMLYVQASVTPRAAIADSLRWLDEVPEARPTEMPSRPALPSSIEFTVDGVRVRERMISVPVAAGEARGVITEPVGAESQALAAVFISASADRHIGPNRLWVTTSRRWAARGITAVRLDPPGLGDAPGDEHAWDRMWDIFSPRTVAEEHTILDALRAAGLPRRTVLVGFCSGAYRSLRVALGDRDVVGAFLIGLPLFRRSWWTVLVRNHWIVLWKPEQRHGRAKIATARVLKRLIALTRAVQGSAIELTQTRRNAPERLLARLSTRGTHVLLLLKRADWSAEQMQPPPRQARLGKLANLHVETLPSNDLRFRPAPAQAWVRNQLDAALDRLLGAAESDEDLTVARRLG